MSRYVAFGLVFAGIALVLFGVELDAAWWSACLQAGGGFVVGFAVFGIDVDR